MTINDLVEMSEEDYQKKRDAIVAGWKAGSNEWRYGIQFFSSVVAGFDREQTERFLDRILPMRETLQGIEKEEKRAYLINKPSEPMVKCDCGHTIPKHSVMSASMGSSCPYCYDNMSY